MSRGGAAGSQASDQSRGAAGSPASIGAARRASLPARPAPAPAPARRPAPIARPEPEPLAEPASRRRRAVFGLAAEAAAQADARRGGTLRTGALGEERPPAYTAVQATRLGTCPCGLPAGAACLAGCGRPVCGDHLLNRSSRLGWNGPYRSEREHTAYLRAFWANPAPLCSWCREAAANAALEAMVPVTPLPNGVLDRLAFLLRHPHDYPRDAWEQTVRQHGGSGAVLRLLAPLVGGRRTSQQFEGRRKGEYLAGVSVGGCTGDQTTYEVLDGSGALWTVRQLGGVLVRKRRAWSWEPTPAERVAQLLPRIVELAAI